MIGKGGNFLAFFLIPARIQTNQATDSHVENLWFFFEQLP
jgi:hypothetical protein